MSVSVRAPWGHSGWYDQVTYDRQVTVYTSNGKVYETAQQTDSLTWEKRIRTVPYTPLRTPHWRYMTNYSVWISKMSRSVDQLSTQRSGPFDFINHTVPNMYANWDEDLEIAGPTLSAAFANLKASAESQALSRLSDKKMELGVSLIEARKTISHLATSAIRLLNLYRAVRKGKFSDAAKILGINPKRGMTKDMSRNWLEYKYAWMPLLSDIHAAYEIARNGLEVPLTLRGSSQSRDTVSVSVPFRGQEDGSANPSTEWQPVKKSKKVQAQLTCKVILYGRVHSAGLVQLSALGLTNPLSIAWELVPWSFVLDWFIPVGTFLEACTATFGLTWMDGCCTKTVSLNTTVESFPPGPPYRKNLPWSSGQQTYEVFNMQRLRYGNFPSPRLFSTTSLSVDKAVTAVALWRSTRR